MLELYFSKTKNPTNTSTQWLANSGKVRREATLYFLSIPSDSMSRPSLWQQFFFILPSTVCSKLLLVAKNVLTINTVHPHFLVATLCQAYSGLQSQFLFCQLLFSRWTINLQSQMIIWSRPKEMSYLCWLCLIVVTENETCVIMKKTTTWCFRIQLLIFTHFPYYFKNLPLHWKL